eukprot:CAMPEP_0198331170 /NCGR_PEP_ID=MMETSP1450-20131203/17404_1 /TAXON_ID=753684 ORGANISM="Madagascaria erythrocladiodes, Strain CCMP3234" /NCGR_SAMPLE_ID=MMETSP1450 /ASSEMBLY_ACC=CAM_ASM_001115 /LENGTH=204 /DNA_ID=CAMNT_0044035525 /DNA_START=173 /DNA_END=784 /DNA_ORIENTATION=+
MGHVAAIASVGVLMIFLTAVARVAVGVAFASDALFALPLAVVVVVVAEVVVLVDTTICGACGAAAPLPPFNARCYATEPLLEFRQWTDFDWPPAVVGVVVMLFSIFAIILCAVKPTELWPRKAARVVAFTTATIAFRLIFLCPLINNGKALPPPLPADADDAVVAAGGHAHYWSWLFSFCVTTAVLGGLILFNSAGRRVLLAYP